MLELPVRVVRYGRNEPLPERQAVRAGPLTATLENGALRYVRLGGHEVLRAVYAAVRDRNWGTIEPRFSTYVVEAEDQAFRVQFTAEHRQGEIDFVWHGAIDGGPDGVITFDLDGEALRTFLRNRIGFCVLHPMEAAGQPVEVETPDRIAAGAFPLDISPHQPFVDVVAIRQHVPSGGLLEVRFAGDLFEMEDQRNWTDASFKTYCTPLRLPIPVEVRAGTRIRQTVTLRVLVRPNAVRVGSGSPASEPAGAGMGARAGVDAQSPPPGPSDGAGALLRSDSLSPAHDSVADVAVGRAGVGQLPPIGLGVATHGSSLSGAEIATLRRLHPAHLRVVLDLADSRWRKALERATTEATALGAALELEIVAQEGGNGLEALATSLSAVGGGRPTVARILVFPGNATETTPDVLARARGVLRSAGIVVPIGGGTRADFVNLNRAVLPLGLLDVVGYAINPQVHAFDNASLVETLAAQAVTVENARRLSGSDGRGQPIPLAIGPVTLRQRLNPAATAAEAEPEPNELPSRVDPRQMSLFAAGWTVGSLHRLAEAGASFLTYFETTGWLGVMERTEGWGPHPRFHSRPGMLFPVYHVLADVGAFVAAAGDDADAVEVLPTTVSAPREVEVLALRAGQRSQIHVANLTDAAQRVRLTVPALSSARLRVLDETTAADAMADAAAFRDRADTLRGAGRGGWELHLLPFAVARIRGDVD